MKKVILFLLVLALALGGIGFAHAAVTDSQDELTVYPTLQSGDPAALTGLTASLTFTCGEHLRWHTDHTFGGGTVTAFVYDQAGTQPPAATSSGTLDVWFSGGLSSSVTGGEFSPNTSEYGVLLQTVADETPAGGSKTMALPLSDYVNYYLPDYQLRYRDERRQCSESASLHAFVAGEQWYENRGCYVPLMQLFRFPVQSGHILSVTVDKDDAGRVVGIELYPETNGPELYFLSDVTAEGIWFVPVFRDENGTPLSYESPQGHGIYFIPWKHNDLYLMTEGQPEEVTPDVKKAELRFPLDEHVRIEHMVIDAENGTAWMLTQEDSSYILTACDLNTGTALTRLEVLPCDTGLADRTGTFVMDEGYLLVTAQEKLALVDAASRKQVFSAPDVTDQTFSARQYDPDTGDLYFDHGLLVLCDSTWYQDGTFWAAAWRQGWLSYYGEYDCSIMRGNDNWYYSYVTAEEYPIILK